MLQLWWQNHKYSSQGFPHTDKKNWDKYCRSKNYKINKWIIFFTPSISILNFFYRSTCHWAYRALSTAKYRRNIDYQEVLHKLQSNGISIRVASPKLVMEEASESYKDITDVFNTCQAAGISRKSIKLRHWC